MPISENSLIGATLDLVLVVYGNGSGSHAPPDFIQGFWFTRTMKCYFKKDAKNGSAVRALFLWSILLTFVARNKFCLDFSLFVLVVFKLKLGSNWFSLCKDTEPSPLNSSVTSAVAFLFFLTGNICIIKKQSTNRNGGRNVNLTWIRRAA